MSKILFPTDFSQTANNAFLYALNLANVLDKEIKIITFKTHLRDYLNLEEEEFNSKTEELKEIAKQNNFEHIKITFSLEIGEFLMSLLDIVNKENVDYIVMGTKGENTLSEKFFGSQTLSVVNNSTVPVLAIPKDVKFKPKRNFAYATMFSDKEESAIQDMIQIAKKHESNLDVLHVEKKSIGADMLLTKREWEVNHPNIEVKMLQGNDVEDTLFLYCKEHHIDVLGIVRREMGPLQSLFATNHSKQILNHAEFAVMIFREN